ncbi:MAG: DUF2997 domain-containing protein [Planctomycetales bacterium]
MKIKTIEVIVSSDGQTKLETKGFTGSVCRDASKLLEAALGKTTEERLTAEYHQTTTEQKARAQQQG